MNTNEYFLGCHLKPVIIMEHLEDKVIRPITALDRDSIVIALTQLGGFSNYCSLYEICDKNYESILSYHIAIKDNFPLNRHRSQEYGYDAIDEMNRLLLNYLSSFVAFRNHLTTRYERLKRKGYSYHDDFKKATSLCFDSSFAYRFFSKLRDYVQHCGMPIGLMEIRELPIHDGTIDIELSIFLDRDTLLVDFKEKWGRQVTHDLQNYTGNIDILRCLREFRVQIQNINLLVSGIEIRLAADSFDTLDKVLHEVQNIYPDGIPFIGCYQQDQTGQSRIQTVEFPLHTMAKFQEQIDGGQVPYTT